MREHESLKLIDKLQLSNSTAALKPQLIKIGISNPIFYGVVF